MKVYFKSTCVLVILLTLMTGGCGGTGGTKNEAGIPPVPENKAPDSPKPLEQDPKPTNKPANIGGREQAALSLAREVYEALEKADQAKLNGYVTRELIDVAVSENGAIDQGADYYWSNGNEEGIDWGPLIAWAKKRPSDTIKNTTASPSIHVGYQMIVVRLELENGYGTILVNFPPGNDKGALSKVFLEKELSAWD